MTQGLIRGQERIHRQCSALVSGPVMSKASKKSTLHSDVVTDPALYYIILNKYGIRMAQGSFFEQITR